MAPTMLEELSKRIQHCCATLRLSRNKRNVGSCWLKSLTAFKLCATTATGCANGHNMQYPTVLGVVGQQCCVRLHAVLHQRVGEHKNMSSSTDKHNEDKHFTVPKDLDKQFSVLKKCNKKFDCLVHEMCIGKYRYSVNFDEI